MPSELRLTTTAEKLLVSTINASVAVLIAGPALLFDLSAFQLKLCLVGAFVAENLWAILFRGYLLPGMTVLGSHWKEDYPLVRQLMHALLYSASFATLLFWIWFPGDLFLFNMLFLQLPCIHVTGTTLHGLLAGKMVDVKPVVRQPGR